MRRRTMKPHMTLACNSGSDYAIRDYAGRVYTPEQARAIWLAGQVRDCNMAFHRLASLDFDVEALKAHYAGDKR